MKYVNTLNEFSSNSEFEPEKVYPAEDYFVSFVTGMGEEDTQKVYGPFTDRVAATDLRGTLMESDKEAFCIITKGGEDLFSFWELNFEVEPRDIPQPEQND